MKIYRSCIILIILTLLLASCAPAATTGATTAATTAAAAQTTAAATTAAATTTAAAAAETTAAATESQPSGLVSDEPVTLSIFIDHSWYPTDKFEGIIPEEITRLTNVTLDPVVGIDAQQLGVMAGSGELPDLVYTSAYITELSTAELCQSYEDLIEKYNVDWDLTPIQLGIGRTYSDDGKAYCILNHYSNAEDWADTEAVQMCGSLIYRTDLWEGVGSPAMESFDDLFDVFGQVKDAYPELGAIMTLNANWNMLTLRYYWGISELEWHEQPDGSFIHYSMDPRYKDLLAWVNKCYRAGFINADESYFVTGSTAIPTEGKFITCSCTQNALPGTISGLQKVDPSFNAAELVPFKQSDYALSDPGWSGTFISNNCKNPEVAIKFIAYMFKPESQRLSQMGREGIEYTMDERGMPLFSDAWKQAITEDNQAIVYNPWFYLGGSEVVESISRIATTPPELCADAYKVMRSTFTNKPWISLAKPKAGSDEKIIMDKISELLNTYEARMILAPTEDDFEKLYGEYVNNAQTTGMTKLADYMSAAIPEMMPLFS